MKSKKTFIFYNDRRDYMEDMSSDEVRDFINGILDYQEGKEVSLSGGLKLVRNRVKKQLDEDKEKREETKEKRRIAGKKGGLQRVANQANAGTCLNSQANQAVNDNVNVNVTSRDINISSVSKKKEITKVISKKERKLPTVDDLVGEFESNELLSANLRGEDGAVRERLEYKERKKELYTSPKMFIRQLASYTKLVRCGETTRQDTGLRFSFGVSRAIERNWKGIYWSDEIERDYQNFKSYYNKTLGTGTQT